jgi:hypothetical protein
MLITLSDHYDFHRSLQGMYLLFNHDGSPFVVIIEGQMYVPVFSEISKVNRFLQEAGHQEKTEVKQVTHEQSFITSIHEQNVKIMFDPYATGGRTRFTELSL